MSDTQGTEPGDSRSIPYDRGAPREAEEPTLKRELYAIFVLYMAIAVIPLLIGWLSS